MSLHLTYNVKEPTKIPAQPPYPSYRVGQRTSYFVTAAETSSATAAVKPI